MKWYRIAPQRVNSAWWDAVLAPLREMEARAVGGMFRKAPCNASSMYEKSEKLGISFI